MPLVVLLVVALLFALEGVLEHEPAYQFTGALLIGVWFAATYFSRKSTKLGRRIGAGQGRVSSLPGPHGAPCSIEVEEEVQRVKRTAGGG